MIYLNAAGTSWPKAPPVAEAMRAALEADPEGWPEVLEAGVKEVAAAFGIRDPGRLLITPGCTSALHVGVADHLWSEGDRVVISAMEHHALGRPTEKLGALGVERVVIPRAGREPFDLEALERVLREGRVRMVAMSGASNTTGELLPFREACAMAHAHGALFLLDTAQLAGWPPLDVEELGVDLLAFAGHKALQGPWGIGGLYVAPHVLMSSPMAVCAAPAEAAPAEAVPAEGEGPAACAPMPGYCDTGSVDRAALAGLVASIGWLAEPAQEDRLERARALTARLWEALDAIEGVRLLGDPRPEKRIPVVAFTAAGRRPAEGIAALRSRGVTAGGGLVCAPIAHEALGTAPDGLVRLSVGPRITEAEIEEAIGALRAALA